MRNTIFGRTGDGFNSELRGNFDYDLKLADDKHGVFTGLEGRLALEARMSEYQELLGAGAQGSGTALVAPIEKDLDDLERRHAILKDGKNYSDLPPDLPRRRSRASASSSPSRPTGPTRRIPRPRRCAPCARRSAPATGPSRWPRPASSSCRTP
jgi:hypothetical protein